MMHPKIRFSALVLVLGAMAACDGKNSVAKQNGRSLGLWDLEPEELDGYFVEIKPFVEQCEFSDCTHTHEPGCAVLAAVEAGHIARSRYESYQRLREGDA